MAENFKLETRNPKRVLGLVGSPRKMGNCEVFTKEVSSHVQPDHRLVLIRLPSLNVMPCNACYGCIMGNPCPSKDDMGFLLSSIMESDALIITSPVYYLGAHSMFKRILDRGFLFYNALRETYGKPCILVNMYGMKGRIGMAPHTLRSLAAFLGLNVKASVNLKAALPGEAIMSVRNRLKAAKLGEMLFSEKVMKNRYGCPFCGCETIRMARGRFICSVCHGHFTIDRHGKAQGMKEGGIFGTPEHMLLHRDWLRGMKRRFLGKKKEIIRSVIRYKEIGQWIEPPLQSDEVDERDP